MAIILHCDINNFYASVECVLNPALSKLPVAVAGSPRQRHGVVLAKNQIAKQMGIKTGDTVWQARQKCPNIICLPPQFKKYQEFSKRVIEIYSRFTDKIESFGPDECWLDVTHSTKLFGNGEQIANKLRELVHKETGLTISVGVSFNKYFAKLGSDLKKPDATTIISRENFRQKIFDLPANSLIFIGKNTYKALNKLNIFTIGDLANSDPNLLKEHFGIIGPRMQKIANGENDSAVEDLEHNCEQKSVGNGLTALRNLTKRDEILSAVQLLSEKVAYRMRAICMQGKTVTLSLRDDKLIFRSHSSTLIKYINSPLEITTAAMQLFDNFWKDCSLSIRAVRVAVSNLIGIDTPEQLTFFDDPKIKKLQKFNQVCDKIRDKYGYYAIRNANTVDKDFLNYFEAEKEQTEEQID